MATKAKEAANEALQEDIDNKLQLRKESFKIMQEYGVEVNVALADGSEFETRVYCSRNANLDEVEKATCLYWMENTKHKKKRHDGKMDDDERERVEVEMQRDRDDRMVMVQASQLSADQPGAYASRYETLRRDR